MDNLPDGLIAIVKHDCPTCVLVEPVLQRLAREAAPLTIYCQDDPAFPSQVPVVDDMDLEVSYKLGTEIVPTLIQARDGREQRRVLGWNRAEWQGLTGLPDLGADLPENRPGCGSKSLDPGVAEALARRFGAPGLVSRRVVLAPLEDEIEAAYERGWSDGLPLVPPTEDRVLKMLAGTSRSPQEVIGAIPPDLAECTVEKVAVNAVMAGCKPEYLPVVLAAVEAALIDEFGMHGLLCTTMFAGPVVIVNGPVATRIGMNSGGNALGQGTRANATIGRALQLVIRNVGGGKPGEIDRACLGTPGKYTFCFAEDEAGSDWESLSVERGFPPGASTVTLFAGEGVQGIVDQHSRTAESLARTYAQCLFAVDHPKLCLAGDALLVVSPEHARVFRSAGWSKARLKEELHELLLRPGADLVPGAGGIAEGIPAEFKDRRVPKFRDGGLNIVRAGGQAGLFSAIIAGWAASGEVGSSPVTKAI